MDRKKQKRISNRKKEFYKKKRYRQMSDKTKDKMKLMKKM